MPIFDQGYQHWNGRLSGHAWRWLVIAREGARVHARTKGVRFLLILAWLPALALGAFLAIYGLLEQQSELFTPLLRGLLPQGVIDDPRTYRVPVWTLAFSSFLYCETFAAMVLVAVVGPNLISQDLRFNAIPLYFSKPLRRIDYFLGK